MFFVWVWNIVVVDSFRVCVVKMVVWVYARDTWWTYGFIIVVI